MKIYTKTGDQGETGMLGGVRISKSSIVIDVTGGLDETNSALGIVASQLNQLDADQHAACRSVQPMIYQIQNDLFDLGSRVSACLSDSSRAVEFSSERTVVLEQWIDQLQKDLPELTAFILPGGSFAGGFLHQARAVCRRTERGLVGLAAADLDWPSGASDDAASQRLSIELAYLNRLSDLLFVMARYVNHQVGCEESKWQPARSNDLG